MNALHSVQRIFSWLSARHENPISRYRLIVSLCASGYLFYYVATSPARPFAVAATTALSLFALDDWYRFLVLRRGTSARSVSNR
jgi:hypothetical protein